MQLTMKLTDLLSLADYLQEFTDEVEFKFKKEGLLIEEITPEGSAAVRVKIAKEKFLEYETDAETAVVDTKALSQIAHTFDEEAITVRLEYPILYFSSETQKASTELIDSTRGRDFPETKNKPPITIKCNYVDFMKTLKNASVFNNAAVFSYEGKKFKIRADKMTGIAHFEKEVKCEAKGIDGEAKYQIDLLKKIINKCTSEDFNIEFGKNQACYFDLMIGIAEVRGGLAPRISNEDGD